MTNRKLTKTVTMSLVALAAATGAAVLEAAGATADTGTISADSIANEPPTQKVPGLTVPAQKIESIFPGLTLPVLTVPAQKIANKPPSQKIPAVIFGDVKGESVDPKH